MYFDFASGWQDEERPSRKEVLIEFGIEWGVGVVVVVVVVVVVWNNYVRRDTGVGRRDTSRIQLCRWLRDDAMKCGRNAERYDDETRKDSRGRVCEVGLYKPVSGTSNMGTIRRIDRRSDPVLVHSSHECNAKRQY